MSRELATGLDMAWRFFFRRGFVDGFGHLSARTEDPNVVLVSRHSLGGDSRPEDFLEVDLSGRIIKGEGKLPGELPIHLEIYKKRPDIGSVAHFHCLYATSFSMSEVKLGAHYFLASIFADGIPVHPDPRFVNTEERGVALAKTLGGARAALMKAHGAVATGADVKEMTGTMFILEDNARRMAIGASMGKPEVLDERVTREVEREILAHMGPFRRIWALAEEEYEDR
jgi:ribulose-5-phosphate 4-epimerase/fuculose-1-phosphate aldolase